MITLKTKYFVSKMLWGILFVISGIIKLGISESSNAAIRTGGDYLAWGMFLVVLAAEFYIEKKQVEPLDELAIMNKLRAKRLIYDGIYVLMIAYLIFGSTFKVVISTGAAFLVLGVFQILEYLFFQFYEKKEVENIE